MATIQDILKTMRPLIEQAEAQMNEMTPLRRMLLSVANDHRSAQEAELKRLLGMWVSELEPVMVFRDNVFVGLTPAGHDTPILFTEANWRRVCGIPS